MKRITNTCFFLNDALNFFKSFVKLFIGIKKKTQNITFADLFRFGNQNFHQILFFARKCVNTNWIKARDFVIA
jgi:hypothetical protein